MHNSLVGVGLRERIRVIASGRIVTGFDIAQALVDDLLDRKLAAARGRRSA